MKANRPWENSPTGVFVMTLTSLLDSPRDQPTAMM